MRSHLLLNVDAGNISVGDLSFYQEHGADIKDESEDVTFVLPLEPGRYKVSVFVEDSWDGPIELQEVVNVPSGKLIVGDVCYLFSDHNAWSKFLETTKFLKVQTDRFCSLSTAGDGSFHCTIVVEPYLLS